MKRGRLSWRGGWAAGSGVTLIELAVGLALVAAILAGTLILWSRAHQAYLATAALAEAQQDLRVAVDFMAREIAAAGRDPAVCAFDYEAGGTGRRDCDAARVGACQARLGGSYDASNGLAGGGPGCTGLAAIPYQEATADQIRIRSDRNDNGRIARMANAETAGAGADRSEEDVRYALSSGAGCPPGVARCVVRDDGSGPAALVAVEVTRLELTYYPRPGAGPCTAVGDPPVTPSPCPSYALPLASQAEADAVARIRIVLAARLDPAGTGGGAPVERTVVTEVAIESRR